MFNKHMLNIIGNPDGDLNDYLSQSFKNDEPNEEGFKLCNGGEGDFMEDCKICEFYKDCLKEVNK
jgi:hypothetical protein